MRFYYLKKKQTIHVLRPLSHWKSEISILQKVYCSAFYRCFRQFCNCIGYQKQINVRLFPFLFQIWQKINTLSRRPFLEASPEMFSHLESHSKISNLVITELFYSHIFNMNKGSLHIRRLKCIHLFVYTKWPYGPEVFPGPVRETGSRPYLDWTAPVLVNIWNELRIPDVMITPHFSIERWMTTENQTNLKP